MEIAIGAWAFVFPELLALARAASARLPHWGDGAAFASDVLLSALLLLPPATAMGATIPLLTQALPRDAVVFGEISLSGALRPIVQADARLREARKLGFAAAYAPAGTKAPPAGLAIHPVADLAAFMEKCFGAIEG